MSEDENSVDASFILDRFFIVNKQHGLLYRYICTKDNIVSEPKIMCVKNIADAYTEIMKIITKYEMLTYTIVSKKSIKICNTCDENFLHELRFYPLGFMKNETKILVGQVTDKLDEYRKYMHEINFDLDYHNNERKLFKKKIVIKKFVQKEN